MTGSTEEDPDGTASASADTTGAWRRTMTVLRIALLVLLVLFLAFLLVVVPYGLAMRD